MAFIDKFAKYCGDSRSLAWLLIGNLAFGVLLWVALLALKLAGTNDALVYTLTVLPSDPLTFATHPWTLLTYMFVHFSVLHLLFNMMWLYWFGRMLADIERPDTVLKLYLGGGIAGGICYVVATAIAGNAPGGFLAGSSTAVLAVMCATGMRMPSRTLNLFLLGEVKLKWIALAAILLTLLGGSGLATQCAHLGGVAFGALWFVMRRRLSRPKVRINARAAAKAMRKNVPDHERLDQLLDKVRISGYDSLTKREKNELNYISSKIN